jgi:hypothetical protein
MPFRLMQVSEDGTEILLPRRFSSIEEAKREADNLRRLFPDRRFIVEEYESETFRHLKFHPDTAKSQDRSL